MSRIVASGSKSISASRAVVGFDQGGDATHPHWWRWLTLRGDRVHLIGNVCDTCEFFFERSGCDQQELEIPQAAAVLANGLRGLDPAVIELFSGLLPPGEYEVLLLKSTVEEVLPGEPGDYFSQEQIAAWGIDGLAGKPHDPRTRYYRTVSRRIRKQGRLFEFVVPLVGRDRLAVERVRFYEDVLASGRCPTAVAISVLDVKTPGEALDSGEPETHYCLAHYLLDGHHKLAAAASTGKPASLMSFLAKSHGVSVEQDVRTVLAALESF